MKRSKQLKNLLVVSILLAVMINSIFYIRQAVAATGESTRKDAFSQNSDKNSNNIHDGFNNSKSNNNNNDTKPNEMSRYAINLIPANPVSQKGICSEIDICIWRSLVEIY